MRKPKILVIVNKNWEMEPVMEAMNTLKNILPAPYYMLNPRPADNYMASCRAEYRMDKYDVLVRCIQDLMDDPAIGKSNSEEKYRVLPDYIKADKPDLIISVSTAESTPDVQEGGSQNGSVIIGANFYMYDAKKWDPTSQSSLAVKEIQTDNVEESLYDLLDEKLCSEIVENYLVPPQNPASPMQVIMKKDLFSVGVVNVEDYKAYEQADPAAYEKFSEINICGTPVCIETTHGIVKMAAGDIPTLFVSPIVDRYKSFAVDVQGTQNHASAYNAGVVVAYLLKALDQT